MEDLEDSSRAETGPLMEIRQQEELPFSNWAEVGDDLVNGNLGCSHPAGNLRIHPNSGPDHGEGRSSNSGNKEGECLTLWSPPVVSAL